MRPSRIVREPTPVASLRTRDEAAAISRAWRELEDVVGMGSRKVFGVVDPSGAEYRACVALRPDDDPVK